MDRNQHSRVVEIIAVAAKSSNDTIANHSQTGSLQKCSTNKVARIVVVRIVTINYNWIARNVSQGRKLDSVELVLSSKGVDGSFCTILVAFGKEIHYVGIWINNWRSSNANCRRDVTTIRVRSLERRVKDS